MICVVELATLLIALPNFLKIGTAWHTSSANLGARNRTIGLSYRNSYGRDLQARLFEVEVTLDMVHGLVTDLALVA